MTAAIFCPHGRDDAECPPIYCDLQPIDPLTGQAILDVKPLTPSVGVRFDAHGIHTPNGTIMPPPETPLLSRRYRRAAVLRR